MQSEGEKERVADGATFLVGWLEERVAEGASFLVGWLVWPKGFSLPPPPHSV